MGRAKKPAKPAPTLRRIAKLRREAESQQTSMLIAVEAEHRYLRQLAELKRITADPADITFETVIASVRAMVSRYYPGSTMAVLHLVLPRTADNIVGQNDLHLPVLMSPAGGEAVSS